jgi:cell division protein FtsB
MAALSSTRSRAGSASAHARAPRSGASRDARRPRRGAAAPARVRWDRVGRLAMLCVLAVLLYLYLSAGVHMFSTWSQSRHDNAAVAALEREHASLARHHETLRKQATLEGEARQLGMMKKGEQPYVVSGLPPN